MYGVRCLFSDHSIQQSWYQRREEKESILNHHGSNEKSLKMALAKKGKTTVVSVRDTSCGMISPRWVSLMKVYDVERPEIPNNSRDVTDDGVQLHRRLYVHS